MQRDFLPLFMVNKGCNLYTLEIHIIQNSIFANIKLRFYETRNYSIRKYFAINKKHSNIKYQRSLIVVQNFTSHGNT